MKISLYQAQICTIQENSAQKTLFPLIWYQVILQASCEKNEIGRTERQTFESRAIEACACMFMMDSVHWYKLFFAFEAQCV